MDPDDPFGLAGWSKLSEYMEIGSIVFECEFGKDLVLLLAKVSDIEYDMSGYVVEAGFAMDQAREQLGRELTGQQMMLVLDIDHTLLQCYQHVSESRGDKDEFCRSRRAHMIPRRDVVIQRNADYVAVPDEQLRQMPQDEQVHFWFHDGCNLYAVAVREGIYKIMELVHEGKYRPLFLTTGTQAYGQQVIEVGIWPSYCMYRKLCSMDAYVWQNCLLSIGKLVFSYFCDPPFGLCTGPPNPRLENASSCHFPSEQFGHNFTNVPL